MSFVTMSSEIASPATIFNTTEYPFLNSNESTSVDDFIAVTDENSTLSTGVDPTLLPPERKLSVAYTMSEAIVSLLAIFGNALVVYIFCKNRSLRRYRNYYIVALAIADFLVGLLGIPFAILASVGLPRNLYGCLFTVSILMVLCTVSILCLVAVSIDRYWATTNPFAYYRNMTTTTAVSIILFCWVAGAIIGFLPLFGWYNREGWERYPTEYCFFTDVMDYSYLVFLYFATIVFPALLMIGFYGYIYHVVLIKIRQKGTLAPQHLRRFSEQSRTGSLSCENRSATQALRIMVSEKRREAKAAKKLGIIVLFFMLCWMPLYTINCIQAFFPNFHVPIEFLNFTIILSHANSALNPFLYAYHLKEFRLAMKNALLALCGKLLCGLVNIHVEKENPLGPMSRSLTMPSMGNVTTVPNPTGKVSIKFRKISRPDELRSVQISPTTNINSSLATAARAASRDNLLYTAGGTDKSLTSLSLASDSSNQLLEIPLQVTTSIYTNNSPKNVHNNGSNRGKSNGPTLYNHLTPSPETVGESSTSPAHECTEKSKEFHTESQSSSLETIQDLTATTTFSVGNNKNEEEEEEEKPSEQVVAKTEEASTDLCKQNECVNHVSDTENNGTSDAEEPEKCVNEEKYRLFDNGSSTQIESQDVQTIPSEEVPSDKTSQDNSVVLATSNNKGSLGGPPSTIQKSQNCINHRSSCCISVD